MIQPRKKKNCCSKKSCANSTKKSHKHLKILPKNAKIWLKIFMKNVVSMLDDWVEGRTRKNYLQEWAQWWEHSPPTTVTRLDTWTQHYMCWLSLLLVLVPAPRVFLRILWFNPPSTKTNTPNSNSMSAFDHYVMLKCVSQVLSIYLFVYLFSMSWKQFFLICFILFRSDFFERVERVLQGLIEENCPVNSRTIRIFMSSTFTGNIWTWGKPLQCPIWGGSTQKWYLFQAQVSKRISQVERYERIWKYLKKGH